MDGCCVGDAEGNHEGSSREAERNLMARYSDGADAASEDADQGEEPGLCTDLEPDWRGEAAKPREHGWVFVEALDTFRSIPPRAPDDHGRERHR